MKQRIDYRRVVPDASKAMMALDAYVRQSGLDRRLLDLINIRVSQMNGCAYCLQMHTKEARTNGEHDERIDLVVAWRESPLFTDQERAALAWAEAVTLVSETRVPDAVFEEAIRHFSEEELVKLTVAAASINALNRLAISMRVVHPVKVAVGAPAPAEGASADVYRIQA